jgi:hypothetical protein
VLLPEFDAGDGVGLARELHHLMKTATNNHNSDKDAMRICRVLCIPFDSLYRGIGIDGTGCTPLK